jgi:hypothetical protein
MGTPPQLGDDAVEELGQGLHRHVIVQVETIEIGLIHESFELVGNGRGARFSAT